LPARKAKSQTSKGLLLKEVARYKHSYILMAPYLLIFFVFTVLPVAVSFTLGFTYFNMLEFPQWVGFDNYARLFLQDDVFLIAVKNTLLFSFITGPISYMLSFLVAWIINEMRPKIRAFVTLVFYAPSIAGNALFIWLILFSSDSYGYLNAFLLDWGFILDPIQWLKDTRFIMPIIIVVQLWLSLGTAFLAFIAGLQGIDRSLYEAAYVDGLKNRWQELWFITLPTMRPQLLFGAVIQITASFGVAEVATALAGFPSTDYAAHTIVTHLMDYGSIRYEMGYACAIATVLTGTMLTANLLIQKLLKKVGD